MSDINPKLVMDLRALTGLPMMKCKQALVSAGGDIEKAIDLLRKEGLKAAAGKAGRAMGDGLLRSRAEPHGQRTTMLLVRCETEPVRNTPMFRAFADALLEIAHATTSADVAALKAARWTGKEGGTVQDALGVLIAKIGENLEIGGVTAWKAGAGEFLGLYAHHDERSGALARLKAPAVTPALETLGKELCQHIVFSKPVAMSRDQIPAEAIEKERTIYSAQVAQDPKMAGKPPQVVENIVKGKVEAFFKERVLPDQGWYRDDKQSVANVLKAQGASVAAYALFGVSA